MIATITGLSEPFGVAVTPNGAYAYVANDDSGTVSVISTATNKVTATITVGSSPYDVAVTPNGTYAYVVNFDSATVSVINVVSGSECVAISHFNSEANTNPRTLHQQLQQHLFLRLETVSQIQICSSISSIQ